MKKYIVRLEADERDRSRPATQTSTQPQREYIDTFPNMLKRQQK